MGLPAPLRAERDAPRTIRASTSSSAMRSPISATSCAPKKRYRAADAVEREALAGDLRDARRAAGRTPRAEEIQTRSTTSRRADAALPGPRRQGRDAGAAGRLERLLQHALRRCCSARSAGPRFGSFVALYGVAETRALIAKALAGALVTAE